MFKKLLIVLLLVMPFMSYGVTLRLLPADSTLLIVDGGGVVFTDTLRLPNSVYSNGAIVSYIDSIAVAAAAQVEVKMTPYLTSTTDALGTVAATASTHAVTAAQMIVSDTLPQLPEAQVWIVTIGDGATYGANDSCYVDPHFLKIPLE